ncbi:unnamed protein product [Heligmosomoides polygyrus]|uniref:Uncharacterized protein n=1 Tax=Heligmosomoides polygyrus TaxID=6339 RepID=A0A3P7UG82_HELPZ|nr:unnamed protein product [Heligmosomoides polygyrus]
MELWKQIHQQNVAAHKIQFQCARFGTQPPTSPPRAPHSPQPAASQSRIRDLRTPTPDFHRPSFDPTADASSSATESELYRGADQTISSLLQEQSEKPDSFQHVTHNLGCGEFVFDRAMCVAVASHAFIEQRELSDEETENLQADEEVLAITVSLLTYTHV